MQKKRIDVLILLAILNTMTFTVTAAERLNLLQNGGFENGTKSWSWGQWKDLPQPGALDKVHQYKGLASYTMTLPGHKGMRQLTGFAKNITNEEDYELSLVLRAKNLPQDSVKISLLQWGTKKNKKIKPQGWVYAQPQMGQKDLITTGGTFNWRKFKVHIYKKSIKPTTKQLTLSIKNSSVGVGELGIDEVSLVAVEPEKYRKPVTQVKKKRTTKKLVKKTRSHIANRLQTVKAISSIASAHFRIFTCRKANLFEGESADILFAVQELPANIQKVELVVTDYFGKTIHTEMRAAKELSAKNKLTLSKLRGWFKLTINAKNAKDKVLETLSASFAILEKMPPDYYEPDSKSLFGGWGHYSRHMDPATLGFKWFRGWYFWRLIQPKEIDPINIPKVPSSQSSQSYLYGLGHSKIPGWATADPKEKRGKLKKLKPFLNFVRTIVTAKKDVISAWEIWNEPYFGTNMWPGDTKSYFDVHKAAYNIIKEIAPNTPAIGICLNSYKDMASIKELFEMGILKYCDGIAIHAYSQSSSPEVAGFRKMLQRLKKLMRDNGGEKPIWNTEFGWRGDAESPIGGPKNQARYTVRSHLIQLAEQVRAFYWTVWGNGRDKTPKGKWRCAFGFFDAYTSTPRPVAAAYGVMTRMMYKSTFIRDISANLVDTTHSLLFADKNGNNMLTLWDHQRKRNILFYAKNGVTLVDIMGNRRKIKPKNGLVTICVSKDPVYVRGMTAADLAMNETLLNAPNRITETILGGSEGVPITLLKRVIPNHTKNVVFRYFNGKGIRSHQSTLKNQASGYLSQFCGTFSTHQTPGLARIFVETSSGTPLGFCTVNLKLNLSISDYKLSYDGGIRRLHLDYRLGCPKAVPGMIVFKGKDGEQRISVRFEPAQQVFDLELPDRVKTGAKYELSVLYNSGGDPVKAFQSPFYYVPVLKTRSKICVDGKLDDWADAEFVDFRTAAWFSTRGGNLDAYDMQCAFALQWNKDKLYLCIRVENDDFFQNRINPDLKNAWMEDSVQVGLDPFLQNRANLRPSGELSYVNNEWPFYQYTIAKLKRRDYLWVDFSSNPILLPMGTINPKKIDLAVTVNKTKRSIIYEMAFDKTLLRPAPLKAGVEIGLSVACNDADVNRKGRLAMEWSSGLLKGKTYSKFGRVFLAREQSSRQHNKKK